MVDFDFSGFMSEISLNVSDATRVFRVSRRTVISWRKSRRIPAIAAQLCKVIAWQAAPWNHSFWRGWGIGAAQLAPPWREDLFGPNWWRATFDLDKPRRAAEARRSAAARELMRQRELERRSAASRKAWERRKARERGEEPAPVIELRLRRGVDPAAPPPARLARAIAGPPYRKQAGLRH